MSISIVQFNSHSNKKFTQFIYTCTSLTIVKMTAWSHENLGRHVTVKCIVQSIILSRNISAWLGNYVQVVINWVSSYKLALQWMNKLFSNCTCRCGMCSNLYACCKSGECIPSLVLILQQLVRHAHAQNCSNLNKKWSSILLHYLHLEVYSIDLHWDNN